MNLRILGLVFIYLFISLSIYLLLLFSYYYFFIYLFIYFFLGGGAVHSITHPFHEGLNLDTMLIG